nr:RNA-directed DNA polymerase, eukaryota [Tanacetum cinerariifolium]
MHLHTNIVRFERAPLQPSRPSQSFRTGNPHVAPFVSALKGIPIIPLSIVYAPAMVLDDTCVVKCDLDNFVMEEVKRFSSIVNLRVLLSNEGFHNVKITYLGGLWVMFELDSLNTKAKFLKHVGVASWFSRLCNAQHDFVSKERIVWVDIEGVPFHTWSRSTFYKIGSKWGEVMEIEECKDDLLARKRICIKTKQEDNILEKFKIIVQRKVFVIRSKELFVWSSEFKDAKDAVYCSNDESDKGDIGSKWGEVMEIKECKDDLLARKRICIKTKQEYNNLEKFKIIVQRKVFVIRSKELFVWSSEFKDAKDAVYCSNDESDKGDVGNVGSKDANCQNMNLYAESDVEGVSDTYFGEQEENLNSPQSLSKGFSSRVMEDMASVDAQTPPDGRIFRQEQKKGGSILEVLDDMIKVGQTMGFTMEGCLKDMESIISSQGDREDLGFKAKKLWIRELNIKHKVSFLSIQETKTYSITAMEAKVLWGNSNFKHIFSEAIGNSGGILCMWDPNVFLKDQHIIFDNFVALYGTWIPDKTKLLIVSVYAPQSVTDKRSLWSFITGLISRWNGESMVMGDFNEVRFERDRLGSVFNVQRANEFNSFILNAGLVEIQLEGYSFTWSHPPASKMNHRPILLREVTTDYGATPFRLYHSWFNLHGFEQMVSTAWNYIVLDDTNGMVTELEKPVTTEEIRKAVWGCGENKSPGPDGFSFEFFCKFWNIIGPNMCVAVEWFFTHNSFTRGCNAFFVSLIPKVQDPTSVSDFRPISLIGSLYKVVTKIPAMRLSLVISDLVSDVQTAFLHNRQILDGPFIINELLSWCRHKSCKSWCLKSISLKHMILYSGIIWMMSSGDPLAPYHFILVMESLHLSVSRVVEAGIFSGIKVDPSLTISHLFYADDVVFIGEWSDGVGVPSDLLPEAAVNIGCSVMKTLSSIQGLWNFFNGMQDDEKKITWVKWSKVLASKKHGGLGVSIFYALNRALLFKWVWRFISRDNSLWFRFISAMHGSHILTRSPFHFSTWNAIIREINVLKTQGVDLLSHCKLRVGSGMRTLFWRDTWFGDVLFCSLFPRLYALENEKDSTMAVKMQDSIALSLRRSVRGVAETQQLESIQDLIGSKVLSNVQDRWVWDLNGEGNFCVKDARDLLDEIFLPKENVVTRWIKSIPIKINVFAWRLHLDRIPTRINLDRRGVQVPSILCPVCNVAREDTSHLFFSCVVATDIARLICRWWNLTGIHVGSYSDWLAWFNTIRLGSKIKGIMEGVFYVTWWSLWNFRNQLLFANQKPRKDVLFDEVVTRSFSWSLARSKNMFSWDSWLQHPYLIAL